MRVVIVGLIDCEKTSVNYKVFKSEESADKYMAEVAKKKDVVTDPGSNRKSPRFLTYIRYATLVED